MLSKLPLHSTARLIIIQYFTGKIIFIPICRKITRYPSMICQSAAEAILMLIWAITSGELELPGFILRKIQASLSIRVLREESANLQPVLLISTVPDHRLL